MTQIEYCHEFMIDHRSYIHNLSTYEIKARKKFRLEQDSNPWPLRYRCSAPPTELSRHLGASLSSIYSFTKILSVYEVSIFWILFHWVVLKHTVYKLFTHIQWSIFCLCFSQLCNCHAQNGINFLQNKVLQWLEKNGPVYVHKVQHFLKCFTYDLHKLHRPKKKD